MAWVKPVLAAAALALVLFVVVINLQSPRHDRVWRDDLAFVPAVARTDGTFTLAPYRAWTYSGDAPVRRDWTTSGPFSTGAVRAAWLVVEPHPGLPVIAHTLVVFAFADGRVLGVSVEARKEADETYSPALGTFNRFELLYQWASPKDLLTRRAVMMDRALFMYPLALSQRETEAFLGVLIAKTEAIAARPRFYNTLSSNCTNELAKAAGLGWDPAFVFTGFAGDALHRMGRIQGEGSFEAARAAARIDARVIAAAGLPERAFNAALFGT